MPIAVFAFYCAAAVSAFPEAAQAGPASLQRLPYAEAMEEMLAPMCTVACEGHDLACMAKCMAPSLTSSAPEAGGDEAACDSLGGVYRHTMPACQQALSELLTLSDDSTVESGLEVVAHIYRACSVQQLCESAESE